MQQTFKTCVHFNSNRIALQKYVLLLFIIETDVIIILSRIAYMIHKMKNFTSL